jgi:predicted PurR-regulated permease PerM
MWITNIRSETMKSTAGQSDQNRLVAAAIEASIRIAVIGAFVFWCFRIFAPFMMLLIWGVIIAVAVFPAYKKIETALRGRRGLAAMAMTIGLLLVLLIPSLLLSKTLVEGIQWAAQGLREGTLRIPPPPEGVGTWPVIGKQLAAVWTMASENVENVIAKMGPEAVEAGKWLLGSAASVGIAILMFVASVIIAGVFLAYSEKGAPFANKLATRLAGEHGGDFVKAAESTIRSVAVGVLGIAFIQAVLAGVGMLVAGIPGAGLLAFLCLILSIVQIGGLPVLLPAAIYMFATGDTLPAVLFSVWAVLIGLSDNVLRPIFLGRSAEAPMLVVLVGSIGGLLASGIVGLFVGAVIFTLGYKLFLVWLEGNS